MKPPTTSSCTHLPCTHPPCTQPPCTHLQAGVELQEAVFLRLHDVQELNRGCTGHREVAGEEVGPASRGAVAPGFETASVAGMHRWPAHAT